VEPCPELFPPGGRKVDEDGSLRRLYNEAEAEFLRQVEQYRARRGLRYLAATDYLAVLLGMGYRRGE
jgi:hypothetical protein